MTRRFRRGGWTRSKRRKRRSTRGASSWSSPQTGRLSELVLEGFRGEGLDDGIGRLRLHHDDFAEDLALPGLRRLLLAGLDHHNTRDNELAVFFASVVAMLASVLKAVLITPASPRSFPRALR